MYGEALGKVTGRCGSCHTMHNSQNGSAVALDGTVGWDGTILQGTPTDTPNDQLLVASCVGCHTATNSETIIDIGGPYPDILRWNYDHMIAGGGGVSDGYFICHSNKDDS